MEKLGISWNWRPLLHHPGHTPALFISSLWVTSWPHWCISNDHRPSSFPARKALNPIEPRPTRVGEGRAGSVQACMQPRCLSLVLKTHLVTHLYQEAEGLKPPVCCGHQAGSRECWCRAALMHTIRWGARLAARRRCCWRLGTRGSLSAATAWRAQTSTAAASPRTVSSSASTTGGAREPPTFSSLSPFFERSTAMRTHLFEFLTRQSWCLITHICFPMPEALHCLGSSFEHMIIWVQG